MDASDSSFEDQLLYKQVRIGEGEMLQPQIRLLTRMLPAGALVVVGLVLLVALFR